jgi:hypothetical protein
LYERVLQYCCCCEGGDCCAVGGGLDPRTAIELSFSVWGGLGKLDRGRDRGETFFPDSSSDHDSDQTFQISRKLSHEHDEFFCLLDSQLWLNIVHREKKSTKSPVQIFFNLYRYSYIVIQFNNICMKISMHVLCQVQ